MTDTEKRILVLQGWVRASVELGFEVILNSRIDARNVHRVALFLPEFGSPKGTAVGIGLPTETSGDRGPDELHELIGCYYSFLNPDAYLNCRLEKYVSTLKDWGYYGDGPKPTWLT